MSDDIEDTVDEIVEQVIDDAEALGISPRELVSRIKVEVEARDE